jgi:diguanylate cyclase (GGDEF)-like protein
LPLVVETMQVVLADDVVALVRVAGSRLDAGCGLPELVIADEDGEHRFCSLPRPKPLDGDDPAGWWHAEFAVPRELLHRAVRPFVLVAGDEVQEIPRIVPSPGARHLRGVLGPLPGRAPPDSEAAAAWPATGGHVLIVDSDELMVATVKAMLERRGFEVTTASDGAEAFERLALMIPDVIVSDLMLPDVGGVSLIARLRQSPVTQAIPVIFLTPAQAGGCAPELDLSTEDYVRKPYRPEELVARVRAKLDQRAAPRQLSHRDRPTGVLSAEAFREELRREIARAHRGGQAGVVAFIELYELKVVRSRLGHRAVDAVALRLAQLSAQGGHPLDVVGRIDRWRFAILLPETSEKDAAKRLDDLTGRIVRARFEAGPETLRFTPTLGYTAFRPRDSAAEVEGRAEAALRYAASSLEVRAARFDPSMRTHASVAEPGRGRSWRERLATPAQIFSTQALGLVLPFCVYWGLDTVGLDVTWPMYVLVVASLLVTSLTIWIEGFLALRRPAPPDEPGAPAPPASAIIAAYLPNEAATVIETVEAFLAIDYEPGLQVILAYNHDLPAEMPIEVELREIASRDSRFVPLRVLGSTSKAQNVNAALSSATGAFVGVFDADHQPERAAYHRAWRWLSNGYDVVQGHCVVRNGDASWVTRTVAVEFEAIYAVSHPGRARFHHFGIFGGSNGYWRTDLLRETRMRGSMLTEDIDASLRVIEEGRQIASDPDLLSRELAPATLRALWNQRMRWAQGWFQVSRLHLWAGLRSKRLSGRQKFGVFYLLGWSQIYPWLSLQMFPIVAYWISKFGGAQQLNWLVPLFVATTVLTLGTGPTQTYFSYRLSAPEIRRHGKWYVWYLMVASVFYTEFKNVITRVAQVKEVAGERLWKVTPRS